MANASHLIEFYGETCPHCISMKPVVAQLEKDLGVTIEKLEVWNNLENKAVMEKYYDLIGEACGGYPGVPAFLNTETKQALCGEQEPDNLKIWATGGKCTDNICMPHSKVDNKD